MNQAHAFFYESDHVYKPAKSDAGLKTPGFAPVPMELIHAQKQVPLHER